MLLPLLETATKMAGASSIHQYAPFWACITPPSELTQCIMKGFEKPYQECIQRVELAKETGSKVAKKWLHDSQAVFFGRFVKKIGTVFVQFAPMLAAKKKDHILVRQHKLFRHPSFETFARSNLKLIGLLEELNSLLPPLFANTPGLGFHWNDDMTLTHSSSSKSTHSVMKMVCGRLTNALIDSGQDQTDGNPLSEILRCATSNNISYEIAEWKRFTQHVLLEMHQKRTPNEEMENGEHTSQDEGISESRLKDMFLGNECKGSEASNDQNKTPVISNVVLPSSNRRIEQCMDMWLNGWGESPELKNLLSRKHSRNKQPLFGSRKDGNAARIAVRRVRLICVTVELLSEELTLNEIQNAVVEKKLFCSRFAKMISTIFRSMGLDGKAIFSEQISKDSRFLANGGIEHLKEQICQILELDK